MTTLQELIDKGVLVDAELLNKKIPEEIINYAIKKYGEELLIIDNDLIEEIKKEINKETKQELTREQEKKQENQKQTNNEEEKQENKKENKNEKNNEENNKEYYEQESSTITNELKKIINETKEINDELIRKKLEIANKTCEGTVRINWNYYKKSKKRTYQDFVIALNKRYKEIEAMIKTRQEFSNTISISRIRVKKEKEPVAFIAMVLDKTETTNGHIILTLEDMTGQIKALISNKNKDLIKTGKDVQLDEVLGFTGKGGGEMVFLESITMPDIPLTKEYKKSPEDEAMLVIGDTHFGSKVFMKKEFEKLLLWINEKAGNEEQKKMARKIKYVVITGDLVEGVGIYPNQENDLAILDIKKQYEECAYYLKQIPKNKHIILIAGNHDAGRLSEPQEPLPINYAQSLWEMPNITLLSNPTSFNIGSTKTFPGFDILAYHGGSFIYYADNIQSIRAAGGQKRVDLIMKHLLQVRHLASTHNAALTVPDPERDYLLIKEIPDFFVSGHIHRSSVANYRNITMINSSCWTDTTEDQIKRGLEPQPARAIWVDLRTRKTRMLNFKKHEKEEEKGD